MATREKGNAGELARQDFSLPRGTAAQILLSRSKDAYVQARLGDSVEQCVRQIRRFNQLVCTILSRSRLRDHKLGNWIVESVHGSKRGLDFLMRCISRERGGANDTLFDTMGFASPVHNDSGASCGVVATLYLALTMLLGNCTLGEEFTELMPVWAQRVNNGREVDVKLITWQRRIGFLILCTLVPSWWIKMKECTGGGYDEENEESLTGTGHEVHGVQQSRDMVPAWNDIHSASTLTQIYSVAKWSILGYNEDTLRFWSLARTIVRVGRMLESPVMAIHLALFYFNGKFLQVSRRILDLGYTVSRVNEKLEDGGRKPSSSGMKDSEGHKIDNSTIQSRGSYEALGVLLVLQVALQAWLDARQVYTCVRRRIKLEKCDEEEEKKSPVVRLAGEVIDLSEINTLAWLGKGEKEKGQTTGEINAGRRCTLCLEAMKNPALATCGHVFCWACIYDWIESSSLDTAANASMTNVDQTMTQTPRGTRLVMHRSTPDLSRQSITAATLGLDSVAAECPLCRQACWLKHLLPLRGWSACARTN